MNLERQQGELQQHMNQDPSASQGAEDAMDELATQAQACQV